MFGCREDFHVNAYLCKQFIGRSHVHARDFAQLRYLCLERLHPAFYLLVQMVNLGLDIGNARPYGAYHELMVFGEATFHCKRNFLSRSLQTSVST